jgi:hypothetical protein
MIELMPNSALPRRWWHWSAVIIAAELLWFCLMYPLVPRTIAAVVLEALLPLTLVGYGYLAVRCVFWISARDWSVWIKRTLATAVSLSVGVAGFGMIVLAVVRTPIEFDYLSIHGL